MLKHFHLKVQPTPKELMRYNTIILMDVEVHHKLGRVTSVPDALIVTNSSTPQLLMLVNDELNEEKKETIFDNLRKIMKENEDTIINNRLFDGRKIKENPPVS